MKAQCLGGFREVGRNAVFINNKDKILFEYGLNVEEHLPPLKPTSAPKHIFITHAHLDHIGVVPANYKRSTPTSYLTSMTKGLGSLILKDSLKVARIRNIRPLFNEKQLKSFLNNCKTITYGQKIKLSESTVTALDGGHLPGSAMYILETKGKRILYTGDINTVDRELVDGLKIPKGKIDVMFMETTYSSREHSPRKENEEKLIKIAKETISNGGVAVIPSFALRMPELLLILSKYKFPYPVYVAGMGVKAAKIMLRNKNYLKNGEKLEKAFENAEQMTRKNMNEVINTPCAVITTGGCLDGGPVVSLLKHLYADEKSSLILTGFQIPKTAGRYLVDTGFYVNENMNLKLKMKVHKLDFSGHAGRNDLINLVKKIRPKKLVCMHGDYPQKFAVEMKSRFGINAIAPKNGEVIDI